MNKKIKKYIGSCCGNSFAIIDCRDYDLGRKAKVDFAVNYLIKCGVDSALFIGKSKSSNVYVEIFERDGTESDFCGNGVILIAYLLKMNGERIEMKKDIAITQCCSDRQMIKMNLKSCDIEGVDGENKCLYVKMGEPHIIFLVDDLNSFNLIKIGKNLQKKYPEGVNVDAIQRVDDSHYLIRTYERGVLAETKSCGTGSLSSYLAVSHFHDKIYKHPIEFKSTGGIHWVSRVGDMLQLETLKKFCKYKIF